MKTDSSNEAISNKTEKLVNALIIFIGIALVAVGVALIFSEHEIIATILISIGASLIASAVIMYLTSIYLSRHSKGVEISEYWGLSQHL